MPFAHAEQFVIGLKIGHGRVLRKIVGTTVILPVGGPVHARELDFSGK